MSVETSEGLLEEIGSQALASGTYTWPAAVAADIDAVATADIVNVSPVPRGCLVCQCLSSCVFGHRGVTLGEGRRTVLQYLTPVFPLS